MRRQRRGVPPPAASAASRVICARLLALAELAPARRLSVYLSTDGEPDVAPLLPHLWRRGTQVFVPVVEHPTLRFAPLCPGAVVAPNRWGIPEPVTPVRIDPDALDGAIVPLVGFDAACNRIGRGAGYYDRAFARPPRPPLVGVAFELQRVEHLAPAAHDVPLDLVVTERAVHRHGTET